MTPARATSPASFFSAIDQAPMTWRHYALWLAASGGAFLDGFSVVALGLSLPLLKHEFSLSPLLIGLMGSALVLGAAASAWLGGVLADRFGRKRVLMFDMALIALAAALAAFAPHPWLLVPAQLLTGMGVGADFPTSASYVSEMMPRATRSRMTVATIAMQSVGMLAAALAGIAITRIDPETSDWRLLLGAVGALAVAFLFARMWAPESVRWLAAKGRIDAARALLAQLSRAFHEKPPSTSAQHALAERPIVPAPPSKSHGAGLGTLFGARFRAQTLLVSLPWMLMDVATYGVGLFTPVILGALHFGGAGAGPIAAEFADAKGSALVDLFLLVGFLVSLWAVPALGRIPMQIGGFFGMAVGMALLLFAVVASDGASAHMGFIIAGFVLFNFSMNVGPNATTFILAPALFPTAVRASASGFAAGAAKVGATFGTFVAPQLQAAWGLDGVVALMTLVSLAGLVATAFFAHAVNEEGALEED
ncbi:MFS transporter [Methylocystis echinoides]|uniref:MFS transporter n=1 Tax=Methylocystis echinoides TaxID=29468 RepID=UPI003424F11D